MSQDDRRRSKRKNPSDPANAMGAGMAVGVALGAAIGAAMDDLALGMAMGIALGAAIGSGYAARERRCDRLDRPESDHPD